MKEPTLRQVIRAIEAYGLIEPGEKVVVGVSGGPDSVCLLHLLSQGRWNVALHVAHLNHMLRGEEAEADARYVSQLAQTLGLAATVEERDVGAYQRCYGGSLEEAARQVRYTFLSQVAETVGAQKVAVGHTADDQVETILLHLIRGTGLTGLGGMKWLSPCPTTQGDRVMLIRPLLEVRRRETEAYCRRHHLDPRWDTSNRIWGPIRNRIRHELMPLLRRYNPKIDDGLLRLGRSLQDDAAFIRGQIARLWPLVSKDQEGAIVLDREAMNAMPPALKRHLLREAVARLGVMGLEAAHVEAMMLALTKRVGTTLALPQGMTFSVEYDAFRLAITEAPISLPPPLAGEYPLALPGETELPGWSVVARITSPEAVRQEDPDQAIVDADAVGQNLMVRA
ncbi:MAG: tRNA lysidine(34) synthetase TilS [Chloroflexi bacterium]|nr:tRNA lysidine(34) synthetase TilS [Chloroflexota bacterium]